MVWRQPRGRPAPLSAFDALDTLLAKLGDRAILPTLSQIVLAGFSAGGQLVQRYAAVGKGSDIDLRYVVGSPSSFLYFGDARPEATTGCADFNQEMRARRRPAALRRCRDGRR